MSISENIKQIVTQLPTGVQLVAVSKFHPAGSIMQAYEAGQRIFGESRVQELLTKAPTLPKDISWHFIGHLQTNKVRQLLPHVSLIHSVDSLKLLTHINREAERINKRVNLLLQIHIAQEETKTGFSIEEIMNLAEQDSFKNYPNVQFCGLMTMATNTDDQTLLEKEFSTAHSTFNHLRNTCFQESNLFTQLSMGMSNDWHIAVQHGATLVRIGTDIFGEREY